MLGLIALWGGSKQKKRYSSASALLLLALGAEGSCAYSKVCAGTNSARGWRGDPNSNRSLDAEIFVLVALGLPMLGVEGSCASRDASAGATITRGLGGGGGLNQNKR